MYHSHASILLKVFCVPMNCILMGVNCKQIQTYLQNRIQMNNSNAQRMEAYHTLGFFCKSSNAIFRNENFTRFCLCTYCASVSSLLNSKIQKPDLVNVHQTSEPRHTVTLQFREQWQVWHHVGIFGGQERITSLTESSSFQSKARHEKFPSPLTTHFQNAKMYHLLFLTIPTTRWNETCSEA